ncbi:MAG TPA: hypothetical protein VFQ85_14550 [Mycobacteriales bacterium]|jgi:hypothetical protein|nr:hypothetical protein [Mycobacteriales bacterium]
MADDDGVVFPEAGGTRSTSAFGRSVVADALRAVDPVGSAAAARDTNWRRGYLTHFRRLVEAGLPTADAAVTVATDGLTAARDRMRYLTAKGEEVPLAEAFDAARAGDVETVTVTGDAERETELALPYRGERLTGDALRRRLDAWVEGGIVEPSVAEAVRDVQVNPEWLDLSGYRVVVLGAGAEMGPLRSLLRWGADVAAVDLPRPDVWERVLRSVREGAGTLRVPVRAEAPRTGDLAKRAGLDLLTDLPTVADWLLGIDGRLVLGNYVYADGATNVRLALAVDALTTRVAGERPDTALAFLGTPTDVYAVPGEAVAFSTEAYGRRNAVKALRRPLKAVSAGRLLRRNYAPGSDPGINDSLVPQQGPNYALAKRVHRWRATVARHEGTDVSFHVAPATRTRSVVKNRVLASAYAGAKPFGIEVFEPETSNTLMAALLVHDLRNPRPPREHPWRDEAYAAAHGGLWRSAYDPRSALGLAVLLGLAGARG